MKPTFLLALWALVLLLLLIIVIRPVVSDPGNSALKDLIPPDETNLRLIVVTTAEERKRGLRDMDRLERNEGMLFVFDREERQCMWNKGIKYPVAVAFFDSARRLLNTVEMPADWDRPVCSSSPALYALEVHPDLVPH